MPGQILCGHLDLKYRSAFLVILTFYRLTEPRQPIVNRWSAPLGGLQDMNKTLALCLVRDSLALAAAAIVIRGAVKRP
jgi:hypothetical protein